MVHKQPQDTFNEMITNTQTSVNDLSYQHPILLVFLRHFGCTFCREAMATLSKQRPQIESLGTRMVLVHLSDNETAESYFKDFGLDGIWHVSDSSAIFYKEFGLVKGNFKQLFGLTMWMDGIKRGAFAKYGVGALLGDGFQMPGVFMIHNGEIHDKFIHASVSDQPDYHKLINCCVV